MTYERTMAEEVVIERRTKKGRRPRIELKRWTEMKMRSKDGAAMKEVKFDVVGMRVLDVETGARVFRHDQLVAVVGKRRGELSLEEVAETYRHRFDLEVTSRFMKQNLFLEGYQTPAVEHVDNWCCCWDRWRCGCCGRHRKKWAMNVRNGSSMKRGNRRKGKERRRLRRERG